MGESDVPHGASGQAQCCVYCSVFARSATSGAELR